MKTIRVVLPGHLRTIAREEGSEVTLEVAEPVSIQSVLDALESRYPALEGTIRDHVTKKRRPFLRFFACSEDLSHDPVDAPLPEAVASGAEPLLVVGAIAGGTTSLLERLDKINARFPETSRYDQAGHAGFQVRKKVFAYFLNNHHGDGIVGLACKVLPGDNQRLIDSDPAKFYMPAYVGSRGWVGLRLDTKKIDWDEVAELMLGSYVLCAPKTLARAVSIPNV
ncbi:MAG TPA: MmcQ/YjbR family DNA-binding protein [Bryobacteraceae bacterium]|jgi:hypothetical protein